MEITAECKKAAGIAARVLSISTPYRLTFTSPPEAKVRIGREVNVCVDLSSLDPSVPLLLYGEILDGIVVGGEVFSAIFETYRQMRFLYQREVLTAYYRNQICGFQLFRQVESDKTCEVWDRELNSYRIKGEESVTEADARAFAIYLFHRYPITFPIKKTNRQIGKMKRRYRYKAVPEAFNSAATTK